MDDLVKRLQNDLKEYQSIPFWSWNDELKEDRLRLQIRQMKEAGIGGFFMHARGGLTTEYLGEEWMRLTQACIDEAEKQGMDAWCYDENGWPSGFAGMKLLEDPGNRAHYLVFERRKTYDPEALSSAVLRDGKLVPITASPDTDEEILTVYDRTNSSVVDILNPEIVRKFIEETHEKYYARFADAFGRVMQGFFTDEPQYFRWDTAYSPLVQEKYRERYHAELTDSLPALFVECEESKPLRWRYWKLMNELYTESFAGQIYAWCEEHHCQLTGHSIEERSLGGQMMCCGGIMPFYEYEHKIGIDWLGRGIDTEAAPKQAGSVAMQLGKKHVLTETFACCGWDVTPKELKRIAEWQYVNGVNQMCQHLYPYSIHGQRKRDYPAFYSDHNTWTQPKEFRLFNDYFTTLGYMLSESREEPEVAVIHPIHSAYLLYSRNDPDCLKELNSCFETLIEKLGREQIGHHYIDESLLKKHGRVEGDRLIMGQCAYRYVTIPEMESLDESTVSLLREYLENGGRLYLEGKVPAYIEGEAKDLSFLKTNVTWEELRPKDYRVDIRNSEIRSTMRTSSFGSFLYAVNLSETETYRTNWTFRSRGACLFDLMNRQDQPVFFERNGEEITVPLVFEPGRSYVIRLCEEAEPAIPSVSASFMQVKSAENLCAKISSCDLNTFTIDQASLSFDGVTYTAETPIMALSDHMLRRRQNGLIRLKYTFTASWVPESIFLECEDMGARRVLLNGKVLSGFKKGTFDPQFLSCDLADGIRLGENELVFEIDYTQPKEVYDIFNGVYYEHSDGTESLINCLSYRTNLEAIYLRGLFSVCAGQFRPGEKQTLITEGSFVLDRPVQVVHADRMVQEGFPFFVGKMQLELEFDADGSEKQMQIEGRFPLAFARINDSEEQILLFDSVCDLSGRIHPGKNKLYLTLYSSCRNVFGPHHYAPDPEPYGVSPNLFSGYGTWDGRKLGQSLESSPVYRSSYAFVPFGVKKITLW